MGLVRRPGVSPGRLHYPVDPDLLTNLKPQQTITEGDTLEAYGLDQPFATLTAAKPDGGTLTISLGNTTTDGNSYYMLMNEQESPVYIISNSLYTEMSKTIYDMCDLPELPQLTEENLQSVTVEGAASTLLRPIDKETPPTRRPGGDGHRHLGCQRRGRHRQRGHRLSAGGAGGADLHQMRGLQAHRRGRCPVRLDAPQATVTILYLNDTVPRGR